MSVLIEFSMYPLDKGLSLSKYVSQLIKVIDSSGFDYQLTAMGTIIETSTVAEATDLVNACYEVLEPDCERVYATVKFDIRKAGKGRIQAKVASVQEKLTNS